MLLSKNTHRLFAITSLVLLISFQSIDAMARIGGGSRSTGFSSSKSYNYSNSSRAGGGANTGMQRNDVVNAERQNSNPAPTQSSSPQTSQTTTQPGQSKIGLSHVAGAAVAGAAVGYMLNSHNNPPTVQNSGGANGQFENSNNGPASNSGFPWGTILMLILGGLSLMWIFKRSPKFQSAGSTIKEVFNPGQIQGNQTKSSFNSTYQTFETEALTFFNALQHANNQGDIAFMKNYAIGDMQTALIEDIQNRSAPSNSRFTSMTAKVIDMSIEGNQSIASVRFTGMVSEANSLYEPMDEVWHLVRQSGDWQLAGIEQV